MMWEDATCIEGDEGIVKQKNCLDVFSYLHHGDINIPGSLSLFPVQDVFKSFIC